MPTSLTMSPLLGLCGRVRTNMQWGRQKRGAQKLVDVNADADRSTAGGR